VDVLVPTLDRSAELAVTLAGLAAQDDPPFRLVLADQSRRPAAEQPAVAAMLRVLAAQGREVEVHRRPERRGVAEQRDFLLGRSRAELVLLLDDDVWLEPGCLARLVAAIDRLGCGLVGCAVQGLSHLDDVRPAELAGFEPWRGPVAPERVRPGEATTRRVRVHNAANPAHLAASLGLDDDEWLAYRIGWVGGCALFRRDALVEAGGFGFWRRLPAAHAGEDVLAQWRVMERRGGAGILPSGAVHLEAPTTVRDRRVDATALIDAGPEDGPERREEEGEDMADTPSPIQVQRFLEGVDYPASRDDLVETARGAGADEPVLAALERLPERDYDAPTAVSEALAS